MPLLAGDPSAEYDGSGRGKDGVVVVDGEEDGAAPVAPPHRGMLRRQKRYIPRPVPGIR